jgi:aldehyde dehydrogenase (NAD+)
MEKLLLHIGGKDRPGVSGVFFPTVDPSRGEPWALVAQAEDADVDEAVSVAEAAFRDPSWSRLTPTRRGKMITRLGDLIASHAEEIAALETRENGKLFKEMVGQLRVVPQWLHYFGGWADKIEGSVIPVDRPDMLTYTRHEPIGVVAVISPWNSPVLITMMMVASALAAGNAVIVKPSEFTTAGPLAALRLSLEAGFPPGIVNVLCGDGRVGDRLVRHPGVRKIGFTGSSETGKKIAAIAGGRLARCTLELGGKSANIVFADSNQDEAEAGVLAGIFAATGQTCIAGSRLLIEESIYDQFLSRIVARAEAIRVGDPTRPETQMGPIATPPQLETVERFIGEARASGCQIVTGGERAQVPGFERGLFYKPTIIEGVPEKSRVAQEEVFGPVLAVFKFKDEADAIRIANDTRFGLAAGVWTTNIKRGHRVANQLQAGTVWINTYRAYSPAAPFGGYKDSGLGRSNGRESLFEYMQTKTVWCELGSEVHDPFVIRTESEA